MSGIRRGLRIHVVSTFPVFYYLLGHSGHSSLITRASKRHLPSTCSTCDFTSWGDSRTRRQPH